MADYDYLDGSQDDGTILGQSSSSKIAFYGITPVDQPDAATTVKTTVAYTSGGVTVTVTAMTSAAGAYGFTTAEQGQTTIEVVRNLQIISKEIETRLIEVGLIAGGTAATTVTQYDFVGKNAGDGNIFGQDSTEKIGVWGITPCDQPATDTAAATAIVVTTAGAQVFDMGTLTTVNTESYRWTTIGQANATIEAIVNCQTRIREIKSKLEEAGIIAGGTAVTVTSKYNYLDKGNDGGTICIVTATNKLGFWGVAPVSQGAALTTALTTITGIPATLSAYTLTSFVSASAGAYGFINLTTGMTFCQVVENLQTRTAEMESRLEAIGILASA